MKNKQLLIFDMFEKLVGVLSNDDSDKCPYFSDEIQEKLDGTMVFTFQAPYNHKTSMDYLTVGNLIAYKDEDGKYRVFNIVKLEDNKSLSDNTKKIYCEGHYYELIDHIVEKSSYIGTNVAEAMRVAIYGSRWQVGTVQADIPLPELVDPNDVEFKVNAFTMSPALANIQAIIEKFNVEVEYRIETDGSKITGRFVDIFAKRGANRGTRLTFDKNMQSVRRTVDFMNIKTRIYGKGGIITTNTNGTEEYHDFADAVWSTSKGDPVNKPFGQTYVELPNAVAKFGVRTGVYSSSEQDIYKLLKESYKKLKEYSEPLLTYEVTAIDLERLTGEPYYKIRLGDVILIKDKEFDLLVEARVVEMKRSLTDATQCQLTLGNIKNKLEWKTTINNVIKVVKVNVEDGTRSFVYDSLGNNQTPITPFSVNVIVNGHEETPTAIAWQCGGILTGNGTDKTFLPTVGAYTPNPSFVQVSVIVGGVSYVEIVPIAVSKEGATGPVGTPGEDSNLLPWVEEWNSNTTVIKNEHIVTPKMFIGTKDDLGQLTGIEIGRDVAGETNGLKGIVGYREGQESFALNPDGTAIFGTEEGRQLIINEDGSITLPKIKTEEIDIRAMDKINNWTRSGNTIGWNHIVYAGAEGAIKTVEPDEDKDFTLALKLENKGNVQFMSDFIPVDTTKSYKIAMAIKSLATIGTRYFGIYAYKEDKTLAPLVMFNPKTRLFETTTTNPYIWLKSGATEGYENIEGLLMSESSEVEDFAEGRGAIYRHFKMTSEVKYITIRVLNFSNGEVINPAYFWSPSVTEIGSGKINCGQIKAGTLTLGGEDNAHGKLEILDNNNEKVGEFSAQNGGFTVLRAGEIYANNIVTKTSDTLSYYVDATIGDDNNDGLSWSKPFKTIEKALAEMPKYLMDTAEIWIKGTLNSHVMIRGFGGEGRLNINFFNSTTSIEGSLLIHSCTCPITVSANGGKINYQDGSMNYFIFAVYASVHCRVDNLICNGVAGATRYGILSYLGSAVYPNNCTVNNVTDTGGGAIGAFDMGRIYFNACKGSNNYRGITAYTGGIVGGYGTRPMGALYDGGGRGMFMNSAAWTPAEADGTVEVVKPTVTKTYTATATRSWKAGGGGWRTDNDRVYQGQWDGNGNNKGLMIFPSTIQSDTVGKTITACKITFKRYNGGGSSSAQAITLYEHAYTSIPSSGEPTLGALVGTLGTAKWGETVTFDIPLATANRLKSGVAKGLALYNANGTPYVLMEGVTGVAPKITLSYQ